MGLDSRKWYHERNLEKHHGQVTFLPRKIARNWIEKIFFWILILFVLFKAFQYFERKAFRFSAPSAVIPSVDEVQKPPAHDSVPTTLPGPHSIPADPAHIQRQQPSPVAGQVPASVTIYRCKSYSGGVFWSTSYCGTQSATLDRTATVPGSLPLEQQVQIAEAQRQEALSLYNQQPAPEVQRTSRCAALKREREVIESRYSNWQWQPLEVINPDQTRMKGLRAEQSHLGCATQ